jgi:hypothetical protein
MLHPGKRGGPGPSEIPQIGPGARVSWNRQRNALLQRIRPFLSANSLQEHAAREAFNQLLQLDHTYTTAVSNIASEFDQVVGAANLLPTGIGVLQSGHTSGQRNIWSFPKYTNFM